MKKLLVLLIVTSILPMQSMSANLDGHELAKKFYSLVLKGDTKSILSAFSETPNIDTPRTGAIHGERDFVKFIEDERAWLQQYGVVEDSLIESRTTASSDRIIHEQRITLDKTGPMKQHNFAVVVDLQNNKALAVRVYYGLNAIAGRHDFSRPAILKYNPLLMDTLAAPVKQYVASIDNAYLDVFRLFTEESCIGAFCGINHAKFFVVAMGAGSVPLKLTSSTCDETACTIEWNLASWGETPFSINVGGIATFEFNNEGLITSGRIIDDIHDAPFSQKRWFVDNWDALSKGFIAIGCPMEKIVKPEDNTQMAFKKIMMYDCGIH
jgi:hypothetical protein